MTDPKAFARLAPNSWEARDVAALLHPMTDLVRHAEEGPLVIAQGAGCEVEDIHGRRYVEGVSGLWSISLGFGQQRLVEAAARQMAELSSYHTFRFKSHPRAIELGERLLAMAPAPMSKVFFANSGSEANDTAVKLAWYYNHARGMPEKRKIIGRMGGYHGVTVASGSITGIARNHTDFGIPLPGFLHAGCPHHWKHARPGETEEAFSARLAAELDALIVAEGPETVAAFFAEPVMGSGGVIVPPRGYFEAIVPVLRKHDVLFVVDEVITGFGRLGRMWGSEVYGLAPDILTCAKGLSSGYLPISAVMVNERIWEACLAQSARIGAFGHGFTYSGHPVAAAVALATLDLYEELDTPAHVARVAPLLLEGLAQYADHPLVGEVRGIGLLATVEIVRDRETRAPFAPRHNAGLMFERAAEEEGVILRALGDALTTSPPLVSTEAEIGRIVDAYGVALDRTLDLARRERWFDA